MLEERIAGHRHVHDVAGIGEQAEQMRVALAGAGREHDLLGRDARTATRVVRGDRRARSEVAARVGLVARDRGIARELGERGASAAPGASPQRVGFDSERSSNGRALRAAPRCAPRTRSA